MSGDQRRLLIQREAGRLFARSGYAATTLDDIAAAAGVTKPMVYRHFASKKALYLALLAKHENDLPTFFERIDPDSLDGTPAGPPARHPRRLVRLRVGEPARLGDALSRQLR